MSGIVNEIVEERGKAYGHPSLNHQRTARFWHAYHLNGTLGYGRVGRFDVCFMNILQKIARCQSPAGPSQDSLRDIQGYAENILIMLKEDEEHAKAN